MERLPLVHSKYSSTTFNSKQYLVNKCEDHWKFWRHRWRAYYTEQDSFSSSNFIIRNSWHRKLVSDHSFNSLSLFFGQKMSGRLGFTFRVRRDRWSNGSRAEDEYSLKWVFVPSLGWNSFKSFLWIRSWTWRCRYGSRQKCNLGKKSKTPPKFTKQLTTKHDSSAIRTGGWSTYHCDFESRRGYLFA